MTPRGPYAKGVAKRAEILDAALDVVSSSGYSRTYVAEIADRVGLTAAGFAHYFSTREELYEEVIRARDERDHDRYAAHPEGIEGFLAVIAHNRDVPGLVQLYAEFTAEAAHPSHPSHPFFVERYAMLQRALEADVALAMERGEASPDADAGRIARLMIAAADGLQVQWLLDPGIDMEHALRTLWRALLLASET